MDAVELQEFGITYGRMNGALKHRELQDTITKVNPARTFTKPVEFLAGFGEGGPGAGLFHRRLQMWIPKGAEKEALGCAVRRLLQPSHEAATVVEALRPSFWQPRRDASSPQPDAARGVDARATERDPESLQHMRPRVAIHIRAIAALVDRQHRSDAARYAVTYNAADADLGCVAGSSEAGYANQSSVVEPRLFSEYWQAASEAESLVLAIRLLNATLASKLNATSSTAKKQHASREEVQWQGHWLLASDSMRLKVLVNTSWPAGSGTTSVVPSHARCHGHVADAQERTQRLLQTVAEVLLLSEADAIVHGHSRYASLALLFCTKCIVDMRVMISQARCGMKNRDERCMGDGRIYLAENQLDANGLRTSHVFF